MNDLTIRTLDASKTISEETLAAFAAKLRGEAALPGEAGYEAARTIWNAMIDRRPALAARCRGPADVIHALKFAREEKLLRRSSRRRPQHRGQRGLRRRAPDRSLADASVRVDPSARIARVEAGATLADFDREAQAFALVNTARHQLDYWRRGPHAWGRLRLDDAQVRSDHRQSGLRRPRHRRRRIHARERKRASGPLLGAKRRRGQFRRRDVV